MENRKGSGIFLSVIGVATLIVAIIGATFAYFSATAAGENVVNVSSTRLSLGFSDVTDRLNTNMIPSADSIAEYAAFDEDWTKVGTQIPGDANGDGKTDDGETITSKGECIDQNGNEICSVYEFYIGNPSTTTNMNIEGEVYIVKNEFSNLYYAVYDELGNEVIGATKFLTENDEPAKLGALNQQLLAYENVGSGDNFDEDKPNTYTPKVTIGEDTTADDLDGKTNVRHYTMLIWVREAGGDQTDADSGKIFSAGIRFSTGGSTGVTGMIAVANAS